MEDPFKFLKSMFGGETEIGDKVCDLEPHESMTRETLTKKSLEIENRKKALILEIKEMALANETWWNHIQIKYKLYDVGTLQYRDGSLYKSVSKGWRAED